MIDKKTILITGANRGIGLALVQEALSNDLFVIACSRNNNNNQDLNSLKCDNLQLFKVDVTDEFSIKKMGEAIDKNIGLYVNTSYKIFIAPRLRNASRDKYVSKDKYAKWKL